MRKQILILLLIGCSIITNAQVRNLDRLPIAKRDSILLELAKQTILYYGPDFYEINCPPIIERKVVPIGYENAGRVWFTIKYFYKREFYDKFPGVKRKSFLTEVYIWEDTGLVSDVMFGNIGLADLDKLPKNSTANRKRYVYTKNSLLPVDVDDTTKTVKKLLLENCVVDTTKSK